MFLLLMPSLPIKPATVNYCNYESELRAPLPHSPLLPRRCAEALRELVVLLQRRLVSAPVKPEQGIGCGGGLGTHDRGDVREIARFILDNWAGKSQPMATPPVELIKWCVKYMLGIISTK